MTLWRRVGSLAVWVLWLPLSVYLRFGARTRVLVMASDRVLLVQGWLSEPKWSLPGGGLRRGEDPAAGAVRETLEETGITLDSSVLRPLGSERCSENGLTFYCHFFVVELDEAPVPHARHEIIAVQWFPRTGLSKLPLKADVRRALELLETTRPAAQA